MDVIADVYRDREALAGVLKKHQGIRKLVEDLYPDSAHFIYELLQNAEDAGATSACFTLKRHALTLEHNGRTFTRRDIEAITNIGEGTKAEDKDKIGRFGVGFKAVFAYSETPNIWSPTFSFKISDLVLPTAIDPNLNIKDRTRFEFPFNNPKKQPAVAFAEIAAGLNQIAETTLLFLSHLESISWQIEDGVSGEVLRETHSENHYEALKQTGGRTTTSAHFLKFDEPVNGLPSQRAAIAFALEFVSGIQTFDKKLPLAKQLKICPATPGQVAVFFVAEKEASGLRFHLHAPFVPELSRASIKDTPANEPLFDQLAELTAKSLHQIRDLGLLTTDFLAVLPNPEDPLPTRYARIREAIVVAMNTQALTPTYERKHAPALRLVQAKIDLKRLLSADDIEFLIDYEDEPPLWAASASQKSSNADRFLAGLEIGEWDVDEFVKVLTKKTRSLGYSGSEFEQWLAGKSVEWHQQLYAMFYKELQLKHELHKIKNLPIIRLIGGRYSDAANCFFAGTDGRNDNVLQRVDSRVFSSGKSKQEQNSARDLLLALGVREVGEAELVEATLRKRYTKEAEIPSEETYRRDLKRFVALLDKHPDKAELFRKYYIFEGDDDQWYLPTHTFVDSPLQDTGLGAWYGAIERKDKQVALNLRYGDRGVKLERLAKFAQAVGSQAELAIERTVCYQNAKWAYLCSVEGGRNRSPINEDFHLPELKDALSQPTLALAKLIWRTMCALPAHPTYLLATYQKSGAKGARFADSQLVCCLREVAWVPQGAGVFVCPAEAEQERLPEGFAFDAGWPWLKAINFGQEAERRTEAHTRRREVAKQLGFGDEQSLERARRFAALPATEQERFLHEQEQRRHFELTDKKPADAERRSQRVSELAADAPEKASEERTRSVSIGLDDVKKQAAQYLRQQYTYADGIMICQICKDRLPFKLDNGSEYFEKVELLRGLRKRHYQNYLALCPNHAAMFQHANGSAELLREMLADLSGNELEVILARENYSIYFTRTHVTDLVAVIRTEEIGSKGQ